MKLASLVAVPGVVKDPAAADEEGGSARQDVVRTPTRGAGDAAPGRFPASSTPLPRVSRASAATGEPWRRGPGLQRSALGGPPSRVSQTSPKTPLHSELLDKLSGMRQAFREVAGVVEALGALRSLGGEEALIEMAMFAQSHEPLVERAWRALSACEDAAHRLCLAEVEPGAAAASPPGVPLSSAPPLSSGLRPSAPPVGSERAAQGRAGAPASELEAVATDPAPLPAPELSEAANEEEGPVTQVDAPPSRVLVVDDDPAVLRAFRRVLQGDHEIVTARDGSEALQIVLSGARVDAIICDIGMPKLDGPAFFSELFELRPQLMPRVVFCTGGLPNEKTQRFLDRLQAPLLFKPVAAADLQRAIDLAKTR